VDAGRSRRKVKSARKKESKIKDKERKIPSGPEVRKPHQKLMDQALCPLLLGSGSVVALAIWL